MLVLATPRPNLYNRLVQEVLIYLDDSGVLHEHAAGQFFIYAGYLFLSKKDKDLALARYRAAVQKVRRGKRELKAYGTPGKTKRFLLSQLRSCESLSCTVDKTRVYPSILAAKQSVHRYKDYCVKLAVKAKLESLIERGLLDPCKDTVIRLFIDNQPTSTNGRYTLRDSIFEELKNGIINFNYGSQYPPLFKGDLAVETSFVDSRWHYLIQASDILANAIFTRTNFRPQLPLHQAFHTSIRLP